MTWNPPCLQYTVQTTSSGRNLPHDHPHARQYGTRINNLNPHTGMRSALESMDILGIGNDNHSLSFV